MAGIRAMLAVTDAELLVVYDRLLYRVDHTGTYTLIGGIASDGMVTMARNRLSPSPQVAIVCDGLVYIYQGGALRQLSDPDAFSPISVAHLNGYFSFFSSSGLHSASELDSEDITALSFATAGSNPDPGVRNWVRGQDVLFGGARSIEAWQDVGGDPYPFSRVTNVTKAEDRTDIGVLAGKTVAGGLFVGSDETVRMLDGYSATKISTPAVDRFIASEASADLSACGWSERGHTFYAVSGASGTWVYDLTTRLWHERVSYGLTRWRVQHTEPFGRSVIAGDYNSAKIYRLTDDALDENGAAMVCTLQTAPVHGFPYRFTHHALYVDMVPGVGIVGGATQDANPHLMMDYSDDGGRNFSTQRTAAIGADGDRLRQIEFYRLGMARGRTYRLSCSAKVTRTFISASLDAKQARP